MDGQMDKREGWRDGWMDDGWMSGWEGWIPRKPLLNNLTRGLGRLRLGGDLASFWPHSFSQGQSAHEPITSSFLPGSPVPLGQSIPRGRVLPGQQSKCSYGSWFPGSSWIERRRREEDPCNHLVCALCLCKAIGTESLRSVSPPLPPFFLSFSFSSPSPLPLSLLLFLIAPP